MARRRRAGTVALLLGLLSGWTGLSAIPAEAHGTCANHQYQVRRGEAGYSRQHDSNNDGVGCENLPARPAATPTPTPSAPPARTPVPAPTAGGTTCEQIGRRVVRGIDAAYAPHLDLDGDGVGCETFPAVGGRQVQPVTPVAVGAAMAASGGVWVGYSEGSLHTVGAAPFFGSASAQRLNAPIVGIGGAPGGSGYWLLGQDGGVFSFGNAPFHGSTGSMRLNRPVVGMAAHPSSGYWFVASDGGVFSFNVPFYGSMGGRPLNQPIVGMAPTTSGHGYWLVARDGGIFSFGDAKFSGSTGATRLNQPIVAMAADPDGVGYWFVATDGGVFSFDASFQGSAVGRLAAGDRAVGITGHPGGGYWVITARGAVFGYGAAAGVGRAAP